MCRAPDDAASLFTYIYNLLALSCAGFRLQRRGLRQRLHLRCDHGHTHSTVAPDFSGPIGFTTEMGRRIARALLEPR